MAKLTFDEMSRIGKSNVARSKSHERRVAKLLQDWSNVEFRRRRVEGRDSTVIERESTADVIPVKGEILFSIEAKCGECTNIDGLLYFSDIFIDHSHLNAPISTIMLFSFKSYSYLKCSKLSFVHLSSSS